MSTFRTLVIGLSLLTCLAPANPVGGAQSGPGPGKLYGPTLLSATSSLSLSKAPTRSEQVYTYTVEMTQPSSLDTVVTISNVTNAAEPMDYTVTVPANQLTTTFDVVAASPGLDLLVATSNSKSASLQVLVL